MMRETVGLMVNVKIEVHDAATGELLHEQAHHNLVVDAGLNLLRDWLDGDAPTPPSHLAVGTGSTAPAASQTALVAEVHRLAITQKVGTVSKVQTYKTYLPSTAANGSTLAEAGLFNASSGPVMFARTLISPTIVKTSAIQVTFTWDVTLAAA